jgi:hypothetical protein
MAPRYMNVYVCLSVVSICATILVLRLGGTDKSAPNMSSSWSKSMELSKLFWSQTDADTLESVMDLEQTDSDLIRYIRNHHLEAPSDKPYNLTRTGDHKHGYVDLIMKYLNNLVVCNINCS